MRMSRYLAVTGALLAGCGGGDTEKKVAPAKSPLPQGAEKVKLDPADFTTEIDNAYWPMRRGSRWVYRETNSEGARQKVVVTVTGKTKRIANGVEAVVVRDEVTENGVPVEITDDWYAQDADGNVWYLGEHTTEYENGKPSRRRARSRPARTAPRRGWSCPPIPSPA